MTTTFKTVRCLAAAGALCLLPHYAGASNSDNSAASFFCDGIPSEDCFPSAPNDEGYWTDGSSWGWWDQLGDSYLYLARGDKYYWSADGTGYAAYADGATLSWNNDATTEIYCFHGDCAFAYQSSTVNEWPIYTYETNQTAFINYMWQGILGVGIDNFHKAMITLAERSQALPKWLKPILSHWGDIIQNPSDPANWANFGGEVAIGLAVTYGVPMIGVLAMPVAVAYAFAETPAAIVGGADADCDFANNPACYLNINPCGTPQNGIPCTTPQEYFGLGPVPPVGGAGPRSDLNVLICDLPGSQGINAQVTIGGTTLTTNSGGYADFGMLPNGDYTIYVTADGWQPASQVYSLRGNGLANVRLSQ